MKFIKEHLMFIMPLMAMLIGVEFILVFNRITINYENKLKNEYAILIVSQKSLTTSYLRGIHNMIDSIELMDRKEIVKEVTTGMQDAALVAIMKDMPYFYRIHLRSYLPLNEINKIKEQLKLQKRILNVETFGESYHSKHTMFRLIKMLLNIFIVMLLIVSIMLVIKQMQIWQLAHKNRMQIMEIFGAPMMLRSGILFKIGYIDATIATLLNIVIFFYIKSVWSQRSGIDFIKNNQDLLFNVSDFFIQFVVSIAIVVISVFVVIINTREAIEE